MQLSLFPLHPLLVDVAHEYRSTGRLDRFLLTCVISYNSDTAKLPGDQCKFIIVLKHRSVKVCEESVCTAPLILKLGT
jgi:hypothetical protein